MKIRLRLILFLAFLALFYFWCNAGNSSDKVTSLPCNNNFDLEKNVLASAKKLSGTKYSTSKKTDCSGMFHKMLNTFREDCKEANLPTINNARSSRDIALWYYNHGNFQIVRDPINSDYFIKPGAVLFYGYGSQNGKYDYKNLNINTLIKQGKGINHVSIVTSVTMKDGRVESYEMFHGRNPKHPAGITGSQRKPYRTTMPVYGNGNEPWLAVADIFGY